MPILIRSIQQLDDSARELLDLALEAFSRAAPGYGSVAAGAAVRGASGAAYPGWTVAVDARNQFCAEQIAVAAAVSAGEKSISAAAVILDVARLPSNGAHGSHPCGGCRQLLANFTETDGQEIAVYVSDPRLTATSLSTTGELLPDSLSSLIRHVTALAGPERRLHE